MPTHNCRCAISLEGRLDQLCNHALLARLDNVRTYGIPAVQKPHRVVRQLQCYSVGAQLRLS